MHRRQFSAVCAATALAVHQGVMLSADDKDQWGHLAATFLYDGEPPKPVRIKVDKDEAAIKQPIFDQSLMVDAKTKGIANVVAWLYLAKGANLPPIHPSYETLAKKEVTIALRNAQFEPHVAAIRTGQTLVFKGNDPIGHNVKTDFFENGVLGELIPASGTPKRTFTKPEAKPTQITCSIHPWMNGYILVKDHPYVGISSDQGKLTIQNLPVGIHTFFVWHEQAGFITRVKQSGRDVKWDKGRVTIDIKPGDNDLGEIVFKPERPR